MHARPIYPRLSLVEQSALLSRIVERCKRSGDGPNVVVFDLDGTLIDNRPRTCAILHEIGRAWASREPEVSARLLAVSPSELAYHFRDSLRLLGVTGEDLVDEAFEVWKTHFFADAHLHHDAEVPGASSFACACYAAGATLVYLTGRDLPAMGLGTFASLRDLGFPIGVPGTELVLKPNAEMPDAAFKRFEAPKLMRVGQVVASFDNEPENCNVLAAQYPKSEAVFVDTQHLAGAPPLGAHVRIIKDFVR